MSRVILPLFPKFHLIDTAARTLPELRLVGDALAHMQANRLGRLG